MGNSAVGRSRRIAIITDVHANLPALDAALAAIAGLGCDEIVHTGDAIGIGPYPAETLCRLLALPQAGIPIRSLMGNHDAWFVNGVPAPLPSWMSAGEASHHRWVHAQLDQADPELRRIVATWPWVLDDTIYGLSVRYQHYALTADRSGFSSIVTDPSGRDLDKLFSEPSLGETSCVGPDIVFYGHHHPASDLVGPSARRYVNPGALGCAHDWPALPSSKSIPATCGRYRTMRCRTTVPHSCRPLTNRMFPSAI